MHMILSRAWQMLHTTSTVYVSAALAFRQRVKAACNVAVCSSCPYTALGTGPYVFNILIINCDVRECCCYASA